MDHFIQWDSFEARVSGEKLNAMVRSLVKGVEGLEKVELHFRNGLLRVSGIMRRVIAVPFSVDITEIQASGTTVRVPLRGGAAFGAIPIPRFLFGLVRDQLPREFVKYEEPATLVIGLERFLPSFVSADIQNIWIIDGGLAIKIGRGGADLPQPAGGL